MGAWQYVFENNDLIIRTTSTEVDGISSSSHEEEDSKDNASLITISDLCDTRLTAYVSTGNDLLISFAKSRGEFIICLSFNDNKRFEKISSAKPYKLLKKGFCKACLRHDTIV